MTVDAIDFGLATLDLKNRDDLLKAVLSFARDLEFEQVTAMVAEDRIGSETRFAWVANMPEEYREICENVTRAKCDPVMQHCKRHGTPIAWNQTTYVTVDQGEQWEEQARFGYCTGITFALHLPHGHHFWIGVDRDQELPNDRREVERMTGNLMLFAVSVQEAAMQVLLPTTRERVCARLTPRELDTIRWTMEGKTAWEVAQILSISEQTAVRHLNNATHKLGCVNKHHAVVKALRLGLLH
ncbi:helix-turn-helix transcriptional regulator [Piscinibacter terrae]|uniref:LuxR family transcriptional regulator n=1 Tax=Piscinibacter terrae TaxID=2496871 RepID=A0A3N7JTN0_9BURK|nr:autoinducer binding domain-containing protein [Albitalea terrae]RQP24299.1 LuxR family transcriptional regulator [Albitalea terrae]